MRDGNDGNNFEREFPRNKNANRKVRDRKARGEY
jgi:hypothetical protein